MAVIRGVDTLPAGGYEPRNPRASPLYALVEDYYEEFERIYDERYQRHYGPWRRVIGEVMRKYLECGDLHRGFARLACGGCRYKTILNKARGLRRRQQSPARITPPQSTLPETGQDDFRRHSRRAWARLIRKVHLADPLTCPRHIPDCACFS